MASQGQVLYGTLACFTSEAVGIISLCESAVKSTDCQGSAESGHEMSCG